MLKRRVPRHIQSHTEEIRNKMIILTHLNHLCNVSFGYIFNC